MRAHIYCRVSTKQQATDVATSFTIQVQHCVGFCAMQGWDMAEIVQEVASSKKLSNQSKLLTMIHTMAPGDKLLVMRVDRLSRNVLQALTLIDTLKEKNIQLHSTLEQYDCETPEGMYFMRLALSQAQLENDKLGQKIKWARAAIKSRGGELRRAPFGSEAYRTPEGIRKFRSSDAEMKVVAKVRELRGINMSAMRSALPTARGESSGTKVNKGHGDKAIADYLNEQGIKNRTKAWTASAIHYLRHLHRIQ